MIGKLLCKISLHNWLTVSLDRWLKDGANFECARCGVWTREWPPCEKFPSPPQVESK